MRGSSVHCATESLPSRTGRCGPHTRGIWRRTARASRGWPWTSSGRKTRLGRGYQHDPNPAGWINSKVGHLPLLMNIFTPAGSASMPALMHSKASSSGRGKFGSRHLCVCDVSICDNCAYRSECERHHHQSMLVRMVGQWLESARTGVSGLTPILPIVISEAEPPSLVVETIDMLINLTKLWGLLSGRARLRGLSAVFGGAGTISQPLYLYKCWVQAQHYLRLRLIC